MTIVIFTVANLHLLTLWYALWMAAFIVDGNWDKYSIVLVSKTKAFRKVRYSAQEIKRVEVTRVMINLKLQQSSDISSSDLRLQIYP